CYYLGMKILLVLLFLIPVAFVVIWNVIPPSHDRNWREDYTRLPTVEFNSDEFTVTNVRNWSYSVDGEATEKEWISATIAKENLESIYFIVEPFGNSE